MNLTDCRIMSKRKEKDMSDKFNDNIMHEKLLEYIDMINVQFREPATNIFASLPLLVNNINNQDTEKAMENLQNVYQKTYSILKGVNNISMVAKLLEGYEFDKRIVDFSSLVKSIFSSSQVVLPGYVDTVISVEEGCYIEGNNSLLTVALLNLMLNSLDYRQEDNVRIDVSLKKENGRCVLIYRDNSIGIKPEIVCDIYNPFFTADPYNDGELSARLGVGLYIAKQAFSHAGGTIMLQTEFSEGVSFIISVPESNLENSVVFKNSTKEFLLNRYSEVFVQLCEYCDLPDLI